ncbi:hypothetical protein [Azospirillum doebereinerae]|uniref:Uncharacterized protein n=1 Tax=Azospirillum doebereinerae TaxID=92933 RepID=A0A3S0V465_9PROT|nr:hypothetical protein [Azospirillum doebereinerae]RUQ76109.1 hypothetical protein EJ913_03125 [Azospirillum doebereinerae]
MNGSIRPVQLEKRTRRARNPLPPLRELSYRSGQASILIRSFSMDIAIMVLAALFFFWQTITD